MKHKNLVIIMADQLRYDAFGEHTPNINKLFSESVTFDNAYCACPLCVPARGAFFTGRYPNETGSLINPWVKADAHHGNVKSGIKNLYTMMEDKWDSHHTGKQHLYTQDPLHESPDTKTKWSLFPQDYIPFLEREGKKAPGSKEYTRPVPELVQGHLTHAKRYSIPKTGRYEEGFDYFFDGFIVNKTLEALKNRDKTKPLLLNAMFLAPHPPLQIPEPWYSMIKDVKLPENVGVWYKDQSPLQLYNLPGSVGISYTRKDWEQIWKVYLGLVSLLDYCVGLIIEELKEQGIYDDTMIIFTADHGEMLGSHSLWQKMCMYQESVKTPLAIKFSKNDEVIPKAINENVSSIDILPTICDYLELDKPNDLSGLSLLPLIHNNKNDRENIFIQFDGNGARGNFSRCIIKNDYKLIVDIFKDETFFELYNIKIDTQETNNLAFDNSKLVKEMLDNLKKHMKDTSDLLSIDDMAYDDFLKNYSQFR